MIKNMSREGNNYVSQLVGKLHGQESLTEKLSFSQGFGRQQLYVDYDCILISSIAG